MHAELEISNVKSSKQKFESVALAFIIFDITIFPVSPFFSMPYSTPIALYFVIKYINRKTFNNIHAVSLFIFTLIVSTLFSFISKEPVALIDNGVSSFFVNVQKEDVKRLIYLLVGFMLYKSVYNAYYKYNLNTNLKIKRILLFVCFSFVLFGLIFSVDINLFYLIKGVFFNADVNMATNAVLKNAGYLSRFNFILLDPNNACYFILIIVIFLLENYKLKSAQKTSLWIVMLLSLFLTKSLGGAYALSAYILIKSAFVLSKRINIKKLIVSYGLVLGSLLIIVIDGYTSNIIMDSIVNSVVFQRWSSNSLSGRTDIYLEVLKETPPIIGNGYTLLRKGSYVTPHSDHLRFLYSYGIISYLSLIIMVFNRKFISRNYLFVIPALIAFSINSLIDEPRLLYTFVILLAITNSQKKHEVVST
ncbi:hypothetical protein KCG48_04345 [Proteiniclasticum sp. BAD-10]|uniref:Uncharacterized protein n=1 Tax=Proteiniclasticum sediminis TaxID=2804028 RepID=A0A941CQM2_9CLOT|nr:hypothetical protein [Proteiniclasticum sediminis]MBR0575568.1 hypothetical protein [Proteiniclasticum sediminis]